MRFAWPSRARLRRPALRRLRSNRGRHDPPAKELEEVVVTGTRIQVAERCVDGADRDDHRRRHPKDRPGAHRGHAQQPAAGCCRAEFRPVHQFRRHRHRQPARPRFQAHPGADQRSPHAAWRLASANVGARTSTRSRRPDRARRRADRRRLGHVRRRRGRGRRQLRHEHPLRGRAARFWLRLRTSTAQDPTICAERWPPRAIPVPGELYRWPEPQTGRSWPVRTLPTARATPPSTAPT